MNPGAPDASAELASATNVRTVQVAAYPTASPANWWVGELKRQSIPAYVLQSTVDGKVVYRVRIGATMTGAEARSVAQKIHARYQWPTWITMVEDKSVLPQDELRATRAYVAK
jgi:cell division septation protein DedD